MRSPEVFIAVLSILTLPLAAVAQPQIGFEGDEVVADGITPGGKVALLSAGIERRGFLGHQFRSDDLLTDGDADGTVRLDLGRRAPCLCRRCGAEGATPTTRGAFRPARRPTSPSP